MEATLKDVLSHIKNDQYHPVYIIQGDDSYHIDWLSNYFQNCVLKKEEERDFNQIILYGKEVVVGDILSHAKRFPVMSSRQLVLVKEAQEIKDLYQGESVKLFTSYVKNPAPTTVLVLCYKHKAIDKRTEMFKVMKAHTVMVTCKKLTDRQLPDFVRSYAKDHNFVLEEQVVQVLVEYVGNDLQRLTKEMDKVFLHSAKEEKKITKESIINVLVSSREYNVFELQKAIINGNTMNVEKILRFFETSSRQHPVLPIVAFMFTFFSRVLMAHTVRDKSAKGLAHALQISPYLAYDCSLAVRRFSLYKVIHIITAIKDTDMKLKGVGNHSLTHAQLLRELILQIQYG